jgi:hypothetical protein
MGFHLGKKILVHVYHEGGELYSTFDRDVNDEIVRLELDNTTSDVRRLAELLEIKVMYNIPSYTFVGQHAMAGQDLPSQSVKSRYSERTRLQKKR